MTSKIHLPSVEIEIETAYCERPLLIVTGGRAPAPDWLRCAAKNCDAVWAVDRGVMSCMASDIIPDMLIGDFDSAESGSRQWAEAHNVEIHKYNCDKDFTDSQLAFKHAAERYSGKTLFLTGAWGGRFDHLYSVINSFIAGACPNIPRIAADEKETMIILNAHEMLRVKFINNFVPEAVSLIPLSEACGGVTMRGTHWELENAEISRSWPYAVSNRINTQTVSLSLSAGVLGFYFVNNNCPL